MASSSHTADVDVVWLHIQILVQYFQCEGTDTDLYEVVLDISQEDFNELMRPYSDFSSFLHHLMCFEIFWQSGDLVLSSHASLNAKALIYKMQFPKWKRQKQRTIFDVLMYFSKTDFKILQRPYENFSSFFKHLLILEKYWRLEEVELSPTACRDAVMYVLSNEDLLYVRGRCVQPRVLPVPSRHVTSPCPVPPLSDLTPPTLMPRASTGILTSTEAAGIAGTFSISRTSQACSSSSESLTIVPTLQNVNMTWSSSSLETGCPPVGGLSLVGGQGPKSLCKLNSPLQLKPPQEAREHIEVRIETNKPQLLRFFTRLQETLLQTLTPAPQKTISTSPFCSTTSGSSMKTPRVQSLATAQCAWRISPEIMHPPDIPTAIETDFFPTLFLPCEQTAAVWGQPEHLFKVFKIPPRPCKYTQSPTELIRLETSAQMIIDSGNYVQEMTTKNSIPRIANVWTLSPEEKKELWGNTLETNFLVSERERLTSSEHFGAEPKELYVNIISKSVDRKFRSPTTQNVNVSKPVTVIMPTGVYFIKDSQINALNKFDH